MLRALIVSFAMFAACSSDDGPTTSLDGPQPCGTATCVSGQLCKFQAQGIDAGAGNPPTCETVPSGCHVASCEGTACASCILEMCADRNLDAYVVLAGRQLGCPAQ